MASHETRAICTDWSIVRGKLAQRYHTLDITTDIEPCSLPREFTFTIMTDHNHSLHSRSRYTLSCLHVRVRVRRSWCIIVTGFITGVDLAVLDHKKTQVSQVVAQTSPVMVTYST